MLKSGYEHSPPRTPQHWFPQHEYGSGCHGYILSPTIEEELETLEMWNAILETWKAMVDKKLARIANIIEKSQKEA